MFHDVYWRVSNTGNNRATPAVCMLCVEITCRVQDLPAAAAFLLLYIGRIGQVLLLLSHLN